MSLLLNVTLLLTWHRSVVIDYLHNLSVAQNVGISYLYCDGTPEVSSNFATRLLKQIAMQMNPLPQEIFDFYESHKRMGLPSSSAGFSKIFQLLCPCFRSLFVIIDALDEVKNQTDRKEILQVLKILESAGSSILVTSRPHLRDVNNALQHAKWIDIKAREEDIQAYLRRTLEDDDRLHDLVDDALRASILRKVSEGAGGM
jgi:NACHT domain